MGKDAKTGQRRDLGIDFVRGLALATIFINHIRGNLYENYTSRNFGLSDAAEVFVLLAGMAAAYAYLPKFLAGGDVLASTSRAWQRAAKLYMAHILSTMIALALFAAAAIWLEAGHLLREFNIGPVMDDPVTGIFGIVTLGHQLGYFNILPMYAVLLLALPGMLLLARIGLNLLLAASFLLWLLAGLTYFDLPNYPLQGGWFFNPLAWQVLFVIGFWVAARRRLGWSIPFSRPVFWLAVAYLTASLFWVQFEWWDKLPYFGLPYSIWGFDKTYVSLFRLVHVLALAYVVAMSPLGSWLQRMSSANPFVLMGQHALPVFCVGSVLSMAGLITIDRVGSSFALDTALVAGGLVLQVATARTLAWQAGKIPHLLPRGLSSGMAGARSRLRFPRRRVRSA